MPALAPPAPQHASRTASLKARAERVLMPNYGTREIALVRGKGTRAWDADGREYLDFVAGIAVNNLGHCHPAVVGAIQRQAETLIHVSNGFLIEPQIELAERLCAATGMERAMFANSGAEVTEGAIKLARYWANKHTPARTNILVFEGSFHGRTYGAMSATWSKKVRTGFDPLAPGFVFANLNDLADVDAKWDDSICAVMVETVQGEGGIRPCTPEFLRGLRERATARNAVLIIDEVQCGMGRSGKPMAYQHAGIEPDIVPIAKALGGGFPIGALLARGEFATLFTKGVHGTTFGGNPLACAAACAACDEIFRADFLREVGVKGCKLWGALDAVGKKHPHLYECVRGVGLMLGVVMRVDAAGIPPLAAKHGLLINVTQERVLRFLPPLIVTEAEIMEAADKFALALDEFAASHLAP